MTITQAPLGRRTVYQQQVVGIDYITSAGAFSWTVPTGVDVVDIVAVGGGGGAYTTNSYSGAQSGGVCERVGTLVSAGQIITGGVGAAGVGNPSFGGPSSGGDTTVDGMTAPGGSYLNTSGGSPAARPAGTGGDLNLAGSTGGGGGGVLGGGIPSLVRTSGAPGGTYDDPPYLTPDLTGKGGGSTGYAPGGAGGCWSGNYNSGSGAAGAVVIIMYKLVA